MTQVRKLVAKPNTLRHVFRMLSRSIVTCRTSPGEEVPLSRWTTMLMQSRIQIRTTSYTTASRMRMRALSGRSSTGITLSNSGQWKTSQVLNKRYLARYATTAVSGHSGKGAIGDENEADEERLVSQDDFEDFVEDDSGIDWEAEVLEADSSCEPGIATGGLDWAETALRIIDIVLASQEDIQLYSLKAIGKTKKLLVSLDKLSDTYGSPSLDDIGEFSVNLNAALESEFGSDVAGTIEIEVSSPGAERAVRFPEELLRFKDIPMRVLYATDGASDPDGQQGKSKPQQTNNQVLTFVEYDELSRTTRWRLADVRCNRERKGKGRRLNKKERETIIEIALVNIDRVNLHVDI